MYSAEMAGVEVLSTALPTVVVVVPIHRYLAFFVIVRVPEDSRVNAGGSEGDRFVYLVRCMCHAGFRGKDSRRGGIHMRRFDTWHMCMPFSLHHQGWIG